MTKPKSQRSPLKLFITNVKDIVVFIQGGQKKHGLWVFCPIDLLKRLENVFQHKVFHFARGHLTRAYAEGRGKGAGSP